MIDRNPGINRSLFDGEGIPFEFVVSFDVRMKDIWSGKWVERSGNSRSLEVLMLELYGL